jgi:hypothetical protein
MERLFCASVFYPYSEENSFNVESYASSIAPRYAEILGNNCVKFEVLKGLQPGGNQKLSFICIASFWITSPEQFMSAMQDPRMQELMKEIAAFSPIQPIRQFDEVLA